MGHYFLFLSVLRHLICLPFLGVSNLFSSISGHFHLLPSDFLHHQLQSIAHLIVHLLDHLLPTSCLSTHPPYYRSRSYAGPSLFPTSTVHSYNLSVESVGIIACQSHISQIFGRLVLNVASNVAVSLSAVKSITEMANLCSGQFPQVCTFFINNLAGLGSPMPIDGSIGIKWTPRPGRSSWHFQAGNP